MAREAKFNFEEERRLVEGSRIRGPLKHTASVNAKHGYISFSISYIRDKNLDGSFIKFYGDTQKKAIGWKLLKKETNVEELHGYRQLKIQEFGNKLNDHKSKVCKLMIRALLKSVGVKEKSYIHVPVKKYTSPTILDDDMYYVELNS